MPRKTERIRNHHKGIVKNLRMIVKRADKIPARPGEAMKKALKGDIDFLLKDLTPHAEGEEKGLYPVADKLIRKYGKPTATMSREHVHLKKEVAAYCRAARQIASAKGAVPATARTALWKAAIRLDFLLSVHLEEEEKDLLPYFDRHLSQKEVNAVIEKMHGH
jgi:hemerythrin-like domain-containing protein